MPPPPIRRKPLPSNTSKDNSPMRPGWEREITNKFRQALSTKRMEQLSRRPSSQRVSRSASSRSQPPSYASSQRTQQHLAVPRYGTGDHLAQDEAAIDNFSYGRTPSTTLPNIPLVPAKPTTPQQLQFRSHLMALSETPMKWENPGLLDEAMRAIPLERIYREAEDEASMLKATAASVNLKPRWAHEDCVIRALLKWFNKDFFKWINNPQCSICRCNTYAQGLVAPTPEEVALSAQTVELYKCSNANCGSYERFPRYNDAFVLMQTKRGRCGEWANCFTMLCRAMGSRVRWVWNSEDRAWTEVYSVYRKRWIHVDACENVFNNPTLYTEGWGRKTGYCIAFGADGVMDVTGRYCPNPVKHGLPRNRCPEAVLHHILDEIRRLRRCDRPKADKFKLEGEDMHETHELRHYYIAGFVDELASMVPGGRKSRRHDPDAQKAAERRENVSAEAHAQSQDPTTAPQNNQHPP